MTDNKFDIFTARYIRTMLWAELDCREDQPSVPLDENYDASDISPEFLAQIIDDCAKFQRDNATDIDGLSSAAGHDFWLTRNGHGAGFWDGDWSEEAGERLTKASEAYRECCVCIGDTGQLHSL